MEKGKSELIFDYQVPSKIIELIDHAKKEIIIVSPYIKLWDPLSNALNKAKTKNISISVLTSENCKNLSEIEELTDKIYFLKNLYAKLYLNEHMAILTSMNLHKKSAQKNFEFGYLTTKHDELIQLKTRIWALKNRVWEAPLKPYELIKNGGYCIRCKVPIPNNIQKPLCSDCYVSWAHFKNVNYQEKFCHLCRTPSNVSYAKPLCKNCSKGIIR